MPALVAPFSPYVSPLFVLLRFEAVTSALGDSMLLSFHGHAHRSLQWSTFAFMPALSAAVVLAGCQSYAPAPLDTAAHREAFLARATTPPELATFAKALVPLERSGSHRLNFTDGVGCDEAELIALVWNAELRVARMRAGVTLADARNAGMWDDPTLGVDLARIIESTPNPWKTFSTIGITLPVSGRLRLEKERAHLEHHVELARVAMLEWSTRMTVRRAWTEWSSLQAQLPVTREFLTRLEQIMAIIDVMERSGELARTEARLFRIEHANARSQFALLQAREQEANLRLMQLMGLAPSADVVLHYQGIHPTAGSAQATLVEHIEEHSPAMLVAVADYEVKEKVLELEVRKQYPDLHISPGFGREEAQSQFLLGVSLPLPVLQANSPAIAHARAQRNLAREIAYAQLENTITWIRIAELRVAAAASRREAVEAEIIPLVDAQFADARNIAALGEVKTLVLLESLQRQQDAKLSLVEALRSQALARIDVEELAGPLPQGVRSHSGPASTSHSPTH